VTPFLEPSSHLVLDSGEKCERGRGLGRSPRLALLVAAIVALCSAWAAPAGAAPPTRLVFAAGEIVPLPASVPHEEGDMVDRRIVPDLRWIAKRFPIYITDGYSGPLPNGEHVGCDDCHVKGSDHYNGLAVDIVPLDGSAKCDASWAPITRLAHWAEPIQNQPRPPFRWVGYDGDAGHGCGNHLHLSWEHAPAPMFQLAEWVEVFPTGARPTATQPKTGSAPTGTAPAGVKPPPGPQGGNEPGSAPRSGPRGGVSSSQSGGLAPGD
jgi:hypothetical protein